MNTATLTGILLPRAASATSSAIVNVVMRRHLVLVVCEVALVLKGVTVVMQHGMMMMMSMGDANPASKVLSGVVMKVLVLVVQLMRSRSSKWNWHTHKRGHRRTGWWEWRLLT